MSVLSGGNMIKKKAKKKAKKQSPLDKIQKAIAKLEKLHEKEDAIVESINDIIYEAHEDGADNDLKWR